jgi:hypothetical protein
VGEVSELVDSRARHTDGEVEAVDRLDLREAGDTSEHLAGLAPAPCSSDSAGSVLVEEVAE